MHTRRSEIAQRFAGTLAAVTNVPRAEIQAGKVGAVVACHADQGVTAAIGASAA